MKGYHSSDRSIFQNINNLYSSNKNAGPGNFHQSKSGMAPVCVCYVADKFQIIKIAGNELTGFVTKIGKLILVDLLKEVRGFEDKLPKVRISGCTG